MTGTVTDYTLDELADLVGIGRLQVRYLSDHGDLRVQRFGAPTPRRIHGEDLNVWAVAADLFAAGVKRDEAIAAALDPNLRVFDRGDALFYCAALPRRVTVEGQVTWNTGGRPWTADCSRKAG